MTAERLKKYLDEQHIKYVKIEHSRAYTAMLVADYYSKMDQFK